MSYLKGAKRKKRNRKRMRIRRLYSALYDSKYTYSLVTLRHNLFDNAIEPADLKAVLANCTFELKINGSAQ